MYKRILVLILVCFLLGSMIACAGGTAKTESAPGTEQAETQKSQENTTQAGAQAEITYWEMMWGPADSYTAAVEKLVKKFNDENKLNIKVKVQMTPWDNFYQTFLTAITSGAAPDVSTGAFPQAIQYAKMGEILYLDSIIEEWEKENNPILQDFVPGGLDLEKYEGKQAAIPWNSDPRGIVYRKDIFEKAGITKLPENWNEFLDACKAIKQNTDAVPFVFGAADQMMTQTMMNFMFNNNIGITDKDLKPTMDDGKVVETLKFFSTLYKEGYVPEGIVSYKGADAEKLYFSGKAAMWYNGPPAAIKDYPEIDKVSAILPPMAGPSGTKQNFTWLNAQMAYKQSKNPDAAKAFIKWWSENNLPLWTEGNAGPMPARLSYLKDPYFSTNWIKKEFGEKIMPTAVSPVWPAGSLYPEFSQIEGENYPGLALQDVLGGKTDFEAIAQKVNDMVKKAFTE